MVSFGVTHTLPAEDYIWLTTYAKAEGYESAEDFIRAKIKEFIKETKPMTGE